MNNTIAFVGAGPTTLYTLHALLRHASRPFAVTVFEEQATPGRGTPYRPGWNDPAMLSNIASIEIPPLHQTLLAWLGAQPADRLIALGVDPDAIDERGFYPRLALGAFFVDQFAALVDAARERGIAVDVRTRCRVTDIVSEDDALLLSVEPRRGAAFQARFDHVVLATGHQWPAEPEVRPGYFLSPWPVSALDSIQASAIGVRGSSLTAIDAAVALALRFGDFEDTAAGRLRYVPNPSTDAFELTMLSRKGLIPEADFFHPVPYEPLAICTPAAMEQIIAGPEAGRLDAAYALFKQELAAVDPEYAARIGLDNLVLEDFCGGYFAQRADVDPFVWAEQNLREAERNYAAEHTVPWRYAILRMHEVIALLVPHLDEEDFERFTKSLKPIFVDDYATVPHESINRMIALHDAGKLAIMALGEDYRIDSRRPEGGALLRVAGREIRFPVFIEAVGQRPMAAKDFPFPSLRRQGIVRDADVVEGAKAARGIVIDDVFHPVAEDARVDRLFCLSLPYILGRHPFVQGITSSYEMGEVVGKELADTLDRAAGSVNRSDIRSA